MQTLPPIREDADYDGAPILSGHDPVVCSTCGSSRWSATRGCWRVGTRLWCVACGSAAPPPPPRPTLLGDRERPNLTPTLLALVAACALALTFVAGAAYMELTR